ncbi:hypothetical protein S83_037548 [Arachis hypogaea]
MDSTIKMCIRQLLWQLQLGRHVNTFCKIFHWDIAILKSIFFQAELVPTNSVFEAKIKCNNVEHIIAYLSAGFDNFLLSEAQANTFWSVSLYVPFSVLTSSSEKSDGQMFSCLNGDSSLIVLQFGGVVVI